MAFSSSTVTIGASTKKSDYDRLLDNTQYNKVTRDNDVSFIGTKTFQSNTVFIIKPKLDGIVTRSGTGSVSVECEYVSSAGNSVVDLKTKVIEIGDWDMDATSNITVPHGLSDHMKIRSVNVFIRTNDNTLIYDLNSIHDAASGDLAGGTRGFNSTDIILFRTNTPGRFDQLAYNSTSYNRGWILITYEQ